MLTPLTVTRTLQQLWNTHPPLLISAALTALLGVFFLGGIFLDSRYVTNAPVWLKPLKFAISVTLYSLTLLWILGFVRGRPRLVSTVAWVVVVTFALEFFAIITQAARGTTSHFNVSTALDGALFTLMGVSIMILWVAHLAVTVLLLRQRFGHPALAWALRLGLIITSIGMAQGALMTMPTAQQMAAWNTGAPVTVSGAHAVGTPDGGPGLPVVGWSTRGGDLRVGHFIGIHALQVLPLLAALLMRRRDLTARQQTRLVFSGAGLYLGLTLLATWQALRAQSVTQPDALTVGVLAALVAVAGVTAARTVARPATGQGASTSTRDVR